MPPPPKAHSNSKSGILRSIVNEFLWVVTSACVVPGSCCCSFAATPFWTGLFGLGLLDSRQTQKHKQTNKQAKMVKVNLNAKKDFFDQNLLNLNYFDLVAAVRNPPQHSVNCPKKSQKEFFSRGPRAPLVEVRCWHVCRSRQHTCKSLDGCMYRTNNDLFGGQRGLAHKHVDCRVDNAECGLCNFGMWRIRVESRRVTEHYSQTQLPHFRSENLQQGCPI